MASARRHAAATPSTRPHESLLERPRRAAQVNLGALNERWAKIEFLCDFYKGTDVPLLKFGEEDYEALENDQLTVQGMMASRYVAQFEKEVSMWSVSLLNVADVFTCARGVPRRCLHSMRLVAISLP